jgi:DNA-binding MarR family transcriptional regulator
VSTTLDVRPVPVPTPVGFRFSSRTCADRLAQGTLVDVELRAKLAEAFATRLHLRLRVALHDHRIAAYAAKILRMTAKTNEPLKPREERVWRDVARLLSVAPRLLDEDLQRGANISLSEYAALLHLSEADAGHLRVRELADLAEISGSHMTRIIGDLAKGGFVEKSRNPADGRGIDVQITRAGLKRLRDAYPVHLASVRSRIMNQVEPRELSRFGDVMAAIVKGIEGSPEGH